GRRIRRSVARPQPEAKPHGDPEPMVEPQPDLVLWLSHKLTLHLRLRRMMGSSLVRRTFRRKRLSRRVLRLKLEGPS
ncbi:hypothetical protein L195_g055875, partial [Trifolium pratense]